LSKQTKTSASAPFHGYLFQIERAFLHLAQAQEKCSIFLETEDDVVVELKSGNNLKQIFEQDKLSTSNKNPFSDSNENLWKSLNIWLNLISTNAINLSESGFFLCTNKKIANKSSIVKKIDIAKNEKDAQEVYDEIIKKCQNELKSEKPEKIKLYKPFTKINKTDAITFIQNIELIDFHVYNSSSAFKEKLRNILNIPLDLPIEPIYEELLGWITNRVIDSWKNKLPAEIKSDDFYTKYNSVITKYSEAPFTEIAKELLSIAPSQIQTHLKDTFVIELEKINLDEEDKIEAIDDFLSESIQRSKFAKEGFLTSRDWDKFDESIEKKWKNVFKRTIRLGDFKNDEDRGYNIYLDCMEYKGELAGIQTKEKFTTSGTYHRLANISKLGWHPKWNK